MTMTESNVFLVAGCGRMVAAMQGGAGEGFRPDDRVRILSDGYATRVTR
jgi:hypothetical protein